MNIQNIPIKIDILFEDYISECQYNKQLSIETIKSYREVFKTFKKIMPEINFLHALSPQMMTTFFKRISTRKRRVGKNTVKIGVKTSTIRTYYNKLMAFFKWLEIRSHIGVGFLTSNTVRPPQPIYEDEKALTSEEVSKIIASISLHTKDFSFLYKRDLLMISLLVYTGIRKTELLSLKVQDINFENRSVFVNALTSKSKKSRYIPIHPVLLNLLKIYLEERKHRKSTCDYLIISSKKDTPLSKNGLKHWIEKYRKLSGVKFHLHQMRHTFACSLARSGADISTIMKALGHSTIRITERYLRSITSEESRTYIEKLSF